MRFNNSGPDVPEALIQAQLAGEIMFVVGAGVSRRAGLPLFEGLVEDVYARLHQGSPGTPESLADAAETEAWRRKEWDRVLGLLERRLVYQNSTRPEIDNPVRRTVAEILGTIRQASSIHNDVLEISRDAHGRPRALTTNFDTLLEHAWASDSTSPIRSFAGPGFPAIGTPEFHGILHLHGRIADADLRLEPTDLVLSSADFGEAYLRSGWASRFIYDLLRRYTLVFVGYAADDPPMRYMLEATEAGRLRFPDLRKAYAFVDVTDGSVGSTRELWKAKGLDPIPFNNSDESFENLYQSLAAWAACARDPASWCEAQLQHLTAKPWSEASVDTREKVTFLVKTMTSSATLAQHAASADWINCLIEHDDDAGGSREPRKTLRSRDAIVWFSLRLESIETASWLLSTSPSIQFQAANAIRTILSTREPENDFLNRFWRLFVIAYEDRGKYPHSNWLATQRKLQAGKIDYFVVAAISEILLPRLRVSAPWKMIETDTPKPDASATRLDQLCRIRFSCDEWPSHSEILAAWPQEAESTWHLLNSLTRHLCEVCDLASGAGLIDSDHDSVSRDVRLVHLPHPDDLNPILSDREYDRQHWRPSHPDDFNHSFVPIVRLMSGLWARLVTSDNRRANVIAKAWMESDLALFRRLGYWAATISDSGPLIEASAALSRLTAETFWLRELSPESASFWCKHWALLSSAARKVIETSILDGPKADWFWFASTADDKAKAADRSRHRELMRITTAGGKLSAKGKKRLADLQSRYERLPTRVGVLEGLYHVSWGGSGPSGDVSKVEHLPKEQILQQVDALEKSDQFNQGDLWQKLCNANPGLAFAALVQEATNESWPSHRWRSFLSSMVANTEKDVGKPEPEQIIAAVLSLPESVIRDSLPTLTIWLRTSLKDPRDEDMREAVLKVWDRLLEVARLLPASGNSNGGSERDLMEESVNHPIGQLTEVLITLQDALRAQGCGLYPDFQSRFDALVQLPDHLKMAALAEMIRSLSFFYWLAPEWTEQNLLSSLDRDTAEAQALLGVLMKYGRYDRVEIFNRLKPRIARAIVSSSSEDVLKGLADFVTWAALERIGGNTQVNLTELEGRQLLTRSSTKALRSVAWSLWRALAKEKMGERTKFWQRYIGPFLAEIWPNDVTARDQEISKMLIKIPANAEDYLPQATTIVLRLVVPIREYTVRGSLDIQEKPGVVARFPREILDLASASIDLDAAIPYDLKDFLEQLIKVAPELTIDARYQRLNAGLHRSG
jgi:hypothetical protein